MLVLVVVVVVVVVVVRSARQDAGWCWCWCGVWEGKGGTMAEGTIHQTSCCRVDSKVPGNAKFPRAYPPPQGLPPGGGGGGGGRKESEAGRGVMLLLLRVLLVLVVGRAREARWWRGPSTQPAAVVWTVKSWGTRNSPGPYLHHG